MVQPCPKITSPTEKIFSPLRYPGGKGRLTNFLTSVLKSNECVGVDYYEPFAGGSGAALQLLSNGTVNDIWLNDADPCIYAFWFSILNENKRFVDNILSTPLTIQEWQKQQNIYSNPTAHSFFDVGFATFFLNRCNRSGIIVGSGPIGGYEQKGKWKLDARFNKKNLAARILSIGEYKKKIHVFNQDAIDFLITRLPKGPKRRQVFVYLDPPYLTAGRRLYFSFYKEKDHRQLAKYIVRQKILKWIMTYDNNEVIQEAYSSCREYLFSLRYSLQKKQKAQEMLIVPKNLKLPKFSQCNIKNMNIHLMK